MLNGEKSDRELGREIKKKTNKRRHFLLEKQHENFEVAMRKSEMLAATKVKMSGSEKKSKQTKNKKHNNMYDISSIKRVARNVLEFSLHIVVVQNNGKEMYKKSVLRLQSCFFVN